MLLLVYILRELKIFCTLNMAWLRFLLIGCQCLLISNQMHTRLIMGNSDTIWGRSSWFPLTFSNPGWMLASSFWAKDKETIHAVETPLFTCSKEDQGCSICRVGDSLRFLECRRHCAYWICSKWLYFQRRVLHQLAETVMKVIIPKSPGKTDKSVFVATGQCFSTQVLAFNSCYLRLWNGWSPPFFS